MLLPYMHHPGRQSGVASPQKDACGRREPLVRAGEGQQTPAHFSHDLRNRTLAHSVIKRNTSTSRGLVRPASRALLTPLHHPGTMDRRYRRRSSRLRFLSIESPSSPIDIIWKEEIYPPVNPIKGLGTLLSEQASGQAQPPLHKTDEAAGFTSCCGLRSCSLRGGS